MLVRTVSRERVAEGWQSIAQTLSSDSSFSEFFSRLCGDRCPGQGKTLQYS